MPSAAIAVIGAGQCDDEVTAAAYEIGRLIAERKVVLVTGGLSGVMEAASHGAHNAGGLVVGILPGLDAGAANPWVEVAIPTGMGQLRNGLVVSSAQAVIAVAGEWGTLSEIGFARKLGIPVVGWRSWELAKDGVPQDGMMRANTPAAAVEQAYAWCAEAAAHGERT
jgi:uncharacterized protein (TIGR00725 family)